MAAVIGVTTVAIWVYLLFFRGGFWWLPYRPAPLAANIGGRSVVAVIPARDEAAVVGRAVASLLAQDYDGNFRIVLVDDQSSDGTAETARTAAGAAGGCMLIRAATLERIGGLDSIRGEIIDDCALARRVKSVGKVWLGPARDTTSIREYRSWRPIWDMVVRSAFAQLDYSPLILALTISMLSLTYLAPPLLVLSSDPAAILFSGFALLGM